MEASWDYHESAIKVPWKHNTSTVAPWDTMQAPHCQGKSINHGGTMESPWDHHESTLGSPWKNHHRITMKAPGRHHRSSTMHGSTKLPRKTHHEIIMEASWDYHGRTMESPRNSYTSTVVPWDTMQAPHCQGKSIHHGGTMESPWDHHESTLESPWKNHHRITMKATGRHHRSSTMHGSTKLPRKAHHEIIKAS